MRPRLQVLAIAYACNPTQGSEEGVGWGWVRSIASHHDLHVVTAEFHRQAIEEFCQDNPELPVVWHYVRPSPWHFRPTPMWKGIEGSVMKPIMNFAYASWQKAAYRLASNLARRFDFDLVHLLTYVGFRFPGQFWKLGIPFVWGPIGGLENTPWRFLPYMGWKGLLYYGGRNLINSAQKRVLPGPRRAFHAARDSSIAATRGIQREIKSRFRVESDVVCEIAAPKFDGTPISERGIEEPLRLGWSGVHLVGKALPLLLEALAALPPSVDWRLTVLGTGNCTSAWKARAETIGLSDRITWTGWIPRQDALARMKALHTLVITSLKDLTSTVTLEALAQGLPVICLDHCGFADVVTEDCGIKVPVESPAQVTRSLAQAIRRLADDEAHRRQLAKGAVARASGYTWADKGRRVDAIYRRIHDAEPRMPRRVEPRPRLGGGDRDCAR